MLATKIRFSNFKNNNGKVIFKGFFFKNNDDILTPGFSILNHTSLVDGLVQDFILDNQSRLDDIENKGNIELNTNEQSLFEFQLNDQIEFTSIHCINGISEDYKINYVLIEYYDDNEWKAYLPSKELRAPLFLKNRTSDTVVQNIVLKNKYNIDCFKKFYKDDSSVYLYNDNNNYHQNLIYISENLSTGKCYLEFNLLGRINTSTDQYNNLLDSTSNYHYYRNGIFCHLISRKEEYYHYSGNRRYYFDNSIFINCNKRSVARTEKQGESYYTTEYEFIGDDSNVHPDINNYKIFIDLDSRKIRYKFNNVESLEYDIPDSNTGYDLIFYTEASRNDGDKKYFINDFEIPYLASDDIGDFIFLTENKENYIKYNILATDSIIEDSNQLRENFNDHFSIDLTKKIDLKLNGPFFIYGKEVSNVYGLGYIKSTVHVDRPPKEAFSRKVKLFSLQTNSVIKETISDPLTGLFEFKNINHKAEYLIFSYDYEKNYDAVIAGPLKPKIMPEYEDYVRKYGR